MTKALGLNAMIVDVLKEYGEIPIDLLAVILRRRAGEIEPDLSRLRDLGAVVLEEGKARLSRDKDEGGG